MDLLHYAIDYHQSNRLSDAESIYKSILQFNPHNADALHLLGVLSLQQGDPELAMTLIDKAIQVNPSESAYYSNMGAVLKEQGKLDDAANCCQKAISIRPNHAEAYGNLGAILKQQGKHADAIICYQIALTIKPDYAEACNNFGVLLKEQGKHDEAAAYFERTISIQSNHAEAYNNLGNIFDAQGKPDKAINCYQQSILIKPNFAEAHCNLGAVLKEQGKLDEAFSCCQHALLIKPDFAEGYSNLAAILREKGRFDEAIIHCRKAISIAPNYAEAYSNLGAALKGQGRLTEAIACYRQAILIKPNFAEAHSNLIFSLDLDIESDTQTLQAARKQWGCAHAPNLGIQPEFPNNRDSERPLRIGYVSADFRQHSASVVFGAMLTQYSSDEFEVFAYSNSVIEDRYTQIFRQSVTCWKRIAGMSDMNVAELIRKDQIDILVDLSGHSAGNRLRVFAQKPAPIQVTAWGYVGGTGMESMDNLFADPVLVPPEETPYFAEKVRYLPSFISAFFQDPFPPVNSLPALSSGGTITFGSFNRLCKVSENAYRTWGQILLEIPNSRMIIKTGDLDSPAMQNRVLNHFTQAGIDPIRIILKGRTSWHDNVAAYNQIDISLDPFPHGGGVTSLEGLMMGVPLITLKWPTVTGRLTTSILTTLGLPEWITCSREEYITKAVQWSSDLATLSDLRQQLRFRLMTSIIGNTMAYARSVEKEYREIWRKWCNQEPLSR